MRPVRARLARFLWAVIVEWLFPMHVDKTPAHLQRTEVFAAEPINFYVT